VYISARAQPPLILVIQHFERAKPPAEGNLMLRLNMLIAKNHYDQWRICFTWKDDGPYDVEIVDYH
jgi:plasmid maintenance system killer protein